ncbi:hypothetical protein CR513_17172, partial [Mucuna pruriens]
MVEDIRIRSSDLCESWEALKHLMRARFVPPSYIRDLHNKLQRLLSRVGVEIQDIVELQYYRNLSELVHKVIKVEIQIRRRNAYKKTYVGSSGRKGLGHVMIVKDDGEIRSESSIGEVSTSSESESLSDGCHYDGDFLVEAETHFHSRCFILGNLCSMIIDRGSYVNIASERLVTKLALPTMGELLVDKQVEITFSLATYKDRIVCDVIPIEAIHLLVWRP